MLVMLVVVLVVLVVMLVLVLIPLVLLEVLVQSTPHHVIETSSLAVSCSWSTPAHHTLLGISSVH